ncbi:MAG: hypothetical protein AB1846_11800 [Chloroflexota bacterium]
MYQKSSRYFRLLAALVVLALAAAIAQPAAAVTGAERFHVQLTQNNVEGYDWPVGASVTLTIDDPSNGVGTDFTDTQTADSGGTARFDNVGGIDLAAGMYLTMGDGTTFKDHTVTILALSGVDPGTDTVFGTGTPGVFINTWAQCGSQTATRYVYPDINGDWIADYSVPGAQPDEQTLCDIQPGSRGEVMEPDAEADHTDIDWRVPDPKFSAHPNDDQVDGWDWLLGQTAVLEIDDPLTLPNPDYIDSTTVVVHPGDPNQTFISFNFSGIYDLQPGHNVSVTDGTNTKTHTVTPVAVTGTDPGGDTVSGTAEIGSSVYTEICDFSGCYHRNEIADGSGNWTADFSVAGDEPGEEPTYDIQPGTGGNTIQWDNDRDETLVGWRAPMYTLHAVPSHPEVHGHDWPSGANVTLTIDDDLNPGNGMLYTDTQLSAPGPCGEPCFDLLGVFNLQVGHYVSMTDGAVTKTVHVSVLHVTGIDTASDTLSGVADAGSDVMVNLHSQGGIGRRVVAAGDGTWTADFSTPGDENWEQNSADLVPGDHGRAIQLNPDGSDDGTLEYWGIPPTAFTKNSPPNGALNRPINLTLSWSASSPEATYEYCYDTTNDNACSIWTDAGANTSVLVTGLAYNTRYYWQVRANNQAGTTEANNGTWWSFKTKVLIVTRAFRSIGSQDGWVLESAENSNAGGSLNVSSATFSLGDDKFRRQYRGILSFNTSSLPNNAVITKVTLKIRKQGILGGGNPVLLFQGFMLDVKKGFFGTPALQITDFQAAANKTVGPFKPAPVNNWYSFNLTGAKVYVNKLGTSGGLTQIRLRFKLDDNNNAIANMLNLFSGNAPLASRPLLIVEYFVP